MVGTLSIEAKLGLSDIEIMRMITENPYLRFSIGLESFMNQASMGVSVLSLFRRRIIPEMLAEINDDIISRKKKDDDRDNPSGGPANGW